MEATKNIKQAAETPQISTENSQTTRMCQRALQTRSDSLKTPIGGDK